MPCAKHRVDQTLWMTRHARVTRLDGTQPEGYTSGDTQRGVACSGDRQLAGLYLRMTRNART